MHVLLSLPSRVFGKGRGMTPRAATGVTLPAWSRCGRTQTTARRREARKAKTPHLHPQTISKSFSFLSLGALPPRIPGFFALSQRQDRGQGDVFWRQRRPCPYPWIAAASRLLPSRASSSATGNLMGAPFVFLWAGIVSRSSWVGMSRDRPYRGDETVAAGAFVDSVDIGS